MLPVRFCRRNTEPGRGFRTVSLDCAPDLSPRCSRVNPRDKGGRQGRHLGLPQKGGKEHDVPCHHRLDQCLHNYIEAAGITDDVDGYLFRTARRKTGRLTTNPLFQQDAHRIIRRRAKAAGVETRIGNHTFRATGITAYLKNSGKLEVAQHIANHESPRTTKLYDRRQDEISLDEIERIAI
jgi:integrase/recombinase XerD